MIILQLLINAFSLGSFYALVALGFALIFGVTHAFNLAHGEFILLGGYLAYILAGQMHFPFLWTLPISMLAMIFVAVLLQKLLSYVNEPYELNTLVVTFGLALVLQNGMLMLFSADYRFIRSTAPIIELPKTQLVVTQTQIILILTSILATTALYILLRRTFLGKALRATIQDREAAKLAGINVRRMSLIGFSIGGTLIGLAGPLYARTTYLYPSGGIEATLIAIIITIFAGVGRIRGILLGGWALGIAESLTVYSLGTGWRELVSSLFLISLLLLRPEGILPRRMGTNG
ncbi:MAG: branched-chain amino acid ABC transporter permease [Desulfoferrobacter sp.]